MPMINILTVNKSSLITNQQSVGKWLFLCTELSIDLCNITFKNYTKKPFIIVRVCQRHFISRIFCNISYYIFFYNIFFLQVYLYFSQSLSFILQILLIRYNILEILQRVVQKMFQMVRYIFHAQQLFFLTHLFF